MKKLILIPLVISVFTLSLSAQLKSGYTPFHQLLQNKHGDIQDHGAGRATAYKEIGFIHLVPGSLSWTDADSGLYTYTGQAWQTGGMFYNFNDPKWDTTAKFSVDVDSFGFVHSITGQTFSTATHTYTNSYLYTYTYYGNNYVNTESLKRWNGSGWDDSIQYTYTYDNSNFLINTVVQKGNPLVNDSQYVYTNSGYSTTQIISQVWNGSSWTNAFKVNNNFDANGNKYQSFGFSWSGGTWSSYDLFVQGFDLDNNLVSYLYELWNPTAGTYVNNYQEAYAYVLGNNTRFENYNWDALNNSWTPDLLYTYSYDGHNNPSYEADKVYNSSADTFANTDQYYYYYQAFTVSGIKPVAGNLNIDLFPNPSCGNAAISFSADNAANVLMNIYDTQGNLMKQEKVTTNPGFNQIPVNLSDYAAGTYYVQVADGTNNKSGVLKFVKQ